VVYRALRQVVPLVKPDKVDSGGIWNMASRTRRVFWGAVVALGLMAGLTGAAGATGTGNEGCTPGYWKNHTSNWEEYTTSTTLGSQFTNAGTTFANVTFLQALNFGGGSSLEDAKRILLRASVAAFLNAAHDGLGYPLQRDAGSPTLRQRINTALASTNRQAILNLAAELDRNNNLGCPLN
jgi:hypothetical protein